MYKELAAFFDQVHLHDQKIEKIVSYSPKHLQITMTGYVLGFSGVRKYTPVATPSYWLYEKVVTEGGEGCTLIVETHTGEMTIDFTKMHCIVRPELLVIFPPLDCTLAEYYKIARGKYDTSVVNRHVSNPEDRRKPRDFSEPLDSE
jgi:hypothetical protein